jgi:hypothetical protein
MLLQNEKQLPGRKIPDEYSLIQETGIEPFCIFRSKNFAIFEHLIEIESSKEGGYSLVLHGKVLIRNDLSSLEAQKTTEIFPEIFLESFEPGTRIKLGF